MANYRVRAIGADFEAGDEGCDYLRIEDAKRAAVKAGIGIASDEIERGKKSSIVEIQVLNRGRPVSRFVVALSVDTLR